jgi:phosphatidylglycerophosphate synthase
MTTALWLLLAQGALGAFDTIYYHEWRAHLAAGGKHARPELVLHAVRDFIYALLFGTLGIIAWQGVWAIFLLLLIAAEIGITVADFIVEDKVRAPLGGVFSGERATHTLMAIIYGGMLAHLLPVVLQDAGLETGFVRRTATPELKIALLVMSAGVFASGVRDLCAAANVRGSAWPWAQWH